MTEQHGSTTSPVSDTIPRAPHLTAAGLVWLADVMSHHNVHTVDAQVVQVNALTGTVPVARVTVPAGDNVAMPIDFEYPDDLHAIILRLQAAEDELRRVRRGSSIAS